MRNLRDFIINILEEEDKSAQKEADEKLKSEIKWDMWEAPGVKTNWLKDNFSYNKIQFIYSDTDKGIEICFLMGFVEDTWKMWVGKSGTISYSEDWSWDLHTNDLSTAIMNSLDIICSFIREVENDQHNYVAYYVHI